MRNVVVISALASIITLLMLYVGNSALFIRSVASKHKNSRLNGSSKRSHVQYQVLTTATKSKNSNKNEEEEDEALMYNLPKSMNDDNDSEEMNDENTKTQTGSLNESEEAFDENEKEDDESEAQQIARMRQRLQRVKHELRVLNSILPDQKALYGHIFNNENMEQVSYYSNVASQPWIRTICEIGFAAGHSTVIYMESNPNVKVYSFDDYGRPHIVDLVRRYIGAKYPERHMIISGDSTVTVPEFARRNPNVKCDLISIDGAHHAAYPWNDIVSMKQLASPRNVVLADDYLQKKDFPTPDTKNFQAVVSAWDQAVQKGMIREIETRASKSTFRGYGKGWAYGSYIMTPQKQEQHSQQNGEQVQQ